MRELPPGEAPVPARRSPRAEFWSREVLPFALVYFFLALINLSIKLQLTKNWFNGRLAQNHQQLLAFQYTNNEQSRLFQYYIPELLVRLFGLSVEHAYLVQRWAFVWLAFVLFHAYLRGWFGRELAFAGVCLLAAVLPLTYQGDLQESSPFLMLSFLCGLWAIRDGPDWLVALALLVGALNNETTLILPAVFFFLHFRGWRRAEFWPVAWRTAAVAAPAYLVTALIRYVTRHQKHLGGAFHLPYNLGGILSGLLYSPLDYYKAEYLHPFFFFGPLWVYAYLRLADKPRFLRASLLMVPLFLLAHLITGIIAEVRQMVPLAYVIIPAAFFRLFEDEGKRSEAG
jgi:hypothetical protein